MLRLFSREADHLVPVDATAIAVRHSPVPALAAGEGAELPAKPPVPPVWFDLVNPEPGEIRLVEQALAIALPTRDEMEEIELSARLYQEDGAEFMTMTTLVGLDGDDPVKTPITFILKGQSLVTIRYADPKPFAAFLARARRPNGLACAGGDTVMLGILEAVIDRMADVLERVGNEIDSVSREVFRGQNGRGKAGHGRGQVPAKAGTATTSRDLQALIEQIGRKGDLLTATRESLVSISRLVSYHAALENPSRKGAKDIRQRVKLLQRDAGSLGDHAEFLQGKINFLLDATLGLINLEQNQIIKIFTVASVAFLPPTLVASIYGMNFQSMPELNWTIGYPMALGVMVLSALLPFLFFKRKGWL